MKYKFASDSVDDLGKDFTNAARYSFKIDNYKDVHMNNAVDGKFSGDADLDYIILDSGEHYILVMYSMRSGCIGREYAMYYKVKSPGKLPHILRKFVKGNLSIKDIVTLVKESDREEDTYLDILLLDGYTYLMPDGHSSEYREYKVDGDWKLTGRCDGDKFSNAKLCYNTEDSISLKSKPEDILSFIDKHKK